MILFGQKKIYAYNSGLVTTTKLQCVATLPVLILFSINELRDKDNAVDSDLIWPK